MADVSILADLQDCDTRLHQISHRLDHLPQREQLEAVMASLGALNKEHVQLAKRVSKLAKEQKRLESEVHKLESRKAKNQARLDDSSLTSPREAEALTDEAASLFRRQFELEDHLLELMERLEELGKENSGMRDKLESLEGRKDELFAEIERAEREAQAEADMVLDERLRLVELAGERLVEIYKKRQAQMRGAPAVGRLVGGSCGACHLEIAAVERERIAGLAADEIADCPECGALLVR